MISHGRRPGVPARAMNGLVALLVGRIGLPLPRTRLLRVHGRRTGKLHSVPVLFLPHAGGRYLVAPRGRTDWALNLRAAGWGELIRGRRVERIDAVAVSGTERRAALEAYISAYGWLTRRLFGLPRRPSAEQIDAIAPHHPVFRITTSD
jgi:deazaflavin-dependent oxidoreductase (nitroreductase family)